MPLPHGPPLADRDFESDPFLLVHESGFVSFDVTSNVNDWASIDLDRVAHVLRALRVVPHVRSTQALEAAYRQGDALANVPQGDRVLQCLRPLATASMPAEQRLTLSGRRNSPQDIAMRPFWCDRASASSFFMMADLHYGQRTQGNYVFAMPAKILAELGEISPETGRLKLFPDVRVVPVVPNM